MKMIEKNKNMIIVLVVLVLLVGVGFFFTRGRGADKSGDSADEEILPDVEVIPTVTEDVKVTITADAKVQEASLSIMGVPEGTEAIEYELSYDALVEGEKVPKGVIGTIEFDGKEPVKRTITLGTCSSGTCKYDKGISTVKATLKFSGSYGDQLFESEYNLGGDLE
ncbi:MAG: hypothetical protein UZ22_OP11002000071 [Microgenomates bacterium OLB23]|nr:MAG: hypothetical protein UZ22_OP11002000071 [Microgenomates bacterium OLB23]